MASIGKRAAWAAVARKPTRSSESEEKGQLEFVRARIRGQATDPSGRHRSNARIQCDRDSIRSHDVGSET